MEKIIEINGKLDHGDKRNILALKYYINKGLITVDQVITALTLLSGLYEKEKIWHTYDSFKGARIWICKNMIRVLQHNIIDPIVDDDICKEIEFYQYILDIFVYLTNCKTDELKTTNWYLMQFLVIDTDLKNKYDSKYNSVDYIINNCIDNIA